MKIIKVHSWDVTPEQAKAIQHKLRDKIKTFDDFDSIKTVGGVDVGFVKEKNLSCAALVIFSYPDMRILDIITCSEPINFLYIPTLLAFREVPVVLSCFEKLENSPDMLILDGQGYAHPRRMGLACHVGVLLNIPTIGCAKSRLTGEFNMPDEKKGSYSYLYDKGEIIGAVLRTKDDTYPVFVSIGHKVSLDTSIKLVLEMAVTRIPEPTKIADREVKKYANKIRDMKLEQKSLF